MCMLWQNVASASCGIVSRAGRTMHIKGCRRKRLEPMSLAAAAAEWSRHNACVCVRARILNVDASDTEKWGRLGENTLSGMLNRGGE